MIVLALIAVPESHDPEASRSFDFAGSGLTVGTLAILTWLLISGPELPRSAVLPAVLTVLAGVAAFIFVERRAAAPLVPLVLFRSRVFSAANMMTFLVYGAIGAMTFFLVIQLQISAGFSPLESGLATLPLTVLLFALSARMAVLAQRIGPRIPMTVGPIVCALGMLILAQVGDGSGWALVLSGTSVFGLGLAVLVAPLTAAVLAAAPDRLAGTASGINNAVARTGTLLAVAALPALVGLRGADYQDPDLLTAGYRLATFVTAGLLLAGGLVSWFGLGRQADRG